MNKEDENRRRRKEEGKLDEDERIVIYVKYEKEEGGTVAERTVR